MQTFLPYPSFRQSASVLDRQRLGKQRVEGYQILRTLLGLSTGWQNHPAVQMWRGYEWALRDYVSFICKEWKARGYKDTIEQKIDELEIPMLEVNLADPPWLGNPAFHASHRSNLLRKAPEHYSKFGWTEGPDLEYVWPVK
jgi:hypothetical protein